MKAAIFIFLLLFFNSLEARTEDCGPCKIIRVSGNAEYPPLTWQDKEDPQKLTGFAVELLEMAFAEVGIEIRAVYAGPWKRAQEAMRKGQIDILGGAYITAERQTYMDYVHPPFVMDPTVIFIPKGRPFKFEKWEDLIGLTGGAPTGNSFGETFDRFEKEHLKIERVAKLSQAFKKLVNGRSDYVVYGLYPGLADAETSGYGDRIDYLPKSLISEGLYFTFSKKSPCNCSRLKEHLVRKIEIYTDQQLVEKLMLKYLSIWKEQSSR